MTFSELIDLVHETLNVAVFLFNRCTRLLLDLESQSF